MADLKFDVGFLGSALGWWAVAVEPAAEHLIRQTVAANQGGAHMPTEYRRTVVPAIGIAAGELPALFIAIEAIVVLVRFR